MPGGAATGGSTSASVAQYVLTTEHDDVKADVIHDRFVSSALHCTVLNCTPGG